MLSFLSKIQMLISVLASVFLLVSLLLTVVFHYSFSTDFFAAQYQKLNTAAKTGISQQDLHQITLRLFDNLSGENPSLDMKISVNGKMVEFFSQEDKIHMVDVVKLCANAKSVQKSTFISALFLLGFLFVLVKPKKKWCLKLCTGYITGNILFIFIMAAIFIWMMLDFNNFWNNFHFLFFDNLLWQLPDHSRLLLLVPSEFFLSLCLKIIVTFTVIMFILASTAVLYLVYSKHGNKSYV